MTGSGAAVFGVFADEPRPRPRKRRCCGFTHSAGCRTEAKGARVVGR
ncbi:MAG: hypothetical protein ACLR7U_11205 [Ruthenibacterium lactatiformans]